MLRRLTIIFVLSLLCPVALLAQEKLLTLDDIYDPVKKIDFGGNPPMGLQWLADGQHYLERRRGQLFKVNALTGEAAPFYDAAKMITALAKLPGVSQEEARQMVSPAGLQWNEGRTAVLINHANDLFYYQMGNDSAIRLTTTAEPEVGEEFSPDGKLVSFVRNYNLYVVDVASQRERSLTSDGNAQLFNGRLDWVYQEEVYGRGNFKGYWWSPDSSKLVYLRIDESQVKDFVVVDHLSYQQDLEVTKYPKAGAPNPTVQLGVISAAGGETRWVDNFKYQGGEFLIVRVGWTPDSKKVVYEVQNREQTWLDLNFANPSDGKSETVLKETTKAWVSVLGLPHWLKDGSFLWLSERTGWKHVYHYSPTGELLRPVTTGEWEVRSLRGIDEANGWLYYSSSEHSQIDNHEYRIKLDGSGKTRLTPPPGTHNANFDPTFTYYLDSWSDVTTPTQVRLHRADGALVRTIAENQVAALKQYKFSQPEFLQVKTRDGFVMEAMLIKPPNFDPKKKYPVWSYTYSGPKAPSVRNAWGGDRAIWHQMLAQKGYLIWVCDNRTSSSKGVASAWPAYRNLGELELRDLEDGLAWLKSQPYVDGSRIGLWGWSYGGYMTSYALTHSKSFKVGIAGAPVTDWRLYDSIYTERYMALPQNNPEGYEKSSAVRAAKNLHGKLLLIHGTTDDNVHMQNTIQFVYELQKAGKPFQLMVYPKSRHGVRDPHLVRHMYEMMTNFVLENL